MPDKCLSGPECGLCFTRRDNFRPVPRSVWRQILGPVRPCESSSDEDAIREVRQVRQAPSSVRWGRNIQRPWLFR